MELGFLAQLVPVSQMGHEKSKWRLVKIQPSEFSSNISDIRLRVDVDALLSVSFTSEVRQPIVGAANTTNLYHDIRLRPWAFRTTNALLLRYIAGGGGSAHYGEMADRTYCRLFWPKKIRIGRVLKAIKPLGGRFLVRVAPRAQIPRSKVRQLGKL